MRDNWTGKIDWKNFKNIFEQSEQSKTITLERCQAFTCRLESRLLKKYIALPKIFRGKKSQSDPKVQVSLSSLRQDTTRKDFKSILCWTQFLCQIEERQQSNHLIISIMYKSVKRNLLIFCQRRILFLMNSHFKYQDRAKFPQPLPSLALAWRCNGMIY